MGDISEVIAIVLFALYASLLPETHRPPVLGFKSSLAKLSAVPGPAIGALLWGIDPGLIFIAPALLTPVGILVLLKLKSARAVGHGF